MTKDGKIEWVRYDADDEATHPDTGKELIIIALKGGKVTKRTEYKVEDFDDIAWAYLDIPSWWVRKEDKE